jgi:hypothetical protein
MVPTAALIADLNLIMSSGMPACTDFASEGCLGSGIGEIVARGPCRGEGNQSGNGSCEIFEGPWVKDRWRKLNEVLQVSGCSSALKDGRRGEGRIQDTESDQRVNVLLKELKKALVLCVRMNGWCAGGN